MNDETNNLPSALPPMFQRPIWKKWLWPAVGLLVVLAAIGGGVGYYATKNEQVATAPTEVATITKEIKKSELAPIYKTGEKWLDQPIKLDDLNLITHYYNDGTAVDPGEDGKSIEPNAELGTYYKVGTDGDKDLILLVYSEYDQYVGLLQKIGPTSYNLLVQESPNLFNSDPDPAHKNTLSIPKLADSVSADQTTAYKSLIYQKELIFKGIKISNGTRSYDPFSIFSDPERSPENKLQEVGATEYGKIYTQELGTGDGFNVQVYVLRLPNYTALEYQLRPSFVTDDSVPQVTWKDGSVNKDTYRADGVGSCGSASGIAVLNTTSLAGLVESGKTKGGEKIYEFSDANNQTLQYFYKLYALDGEGKPLEGALTLEQYRAKHGVFVWKDALERMIVFNSTVYGANVECGKPVVYLYPTVPTNVSVQVDAKITKSDPDYGNGWNVLAMPSGQLFSGLNKYDSLFWEGTGKLYPTINSGFIVPQAKLTDTLTAQLHQLGLNQKESADFLEFWLPKMPTTPYVRVTWFGKNQMDQLAPLTVTPKPDTVIRIFMDFEGLNQPIVISPQRLGAPARRGFTVVEWGGLLRSSTAIQ